MAKENQSGASEEKTIEISLNGLGYRLDLTGKTAVLTGFSSDTIKNLEIPDTVTYKKTKYQVTQIADYAFFESGIKTVKIGANVSAIGEGAFAFSEKLDSVSFVNGCSKIGKGAFLMCTGLVSIGLSRKTPVRSIGSGAFSGTGISKLVIPDSTKKLGSYAFSGCDNLKSISIGVRCNSIGQGAFADCAALEKISISKKNKYFKTDSGCIYTMNGKKLVSGSGAKGKVKVLKGTKKVANCAFEGNRKVTAVVLPDSLLTIGENAFMDVSEMKSVTLGSNLKTIMANAFFGCFLLEKITIPQNVESIVGNPFKYCESLSEIVVDEKNTFFKAYKGMLILSSEKKIISAPATSTVVKLPSGTRYIGEFAFCGNSMIKKLKVNKKLKSVGTGAFYDCYSLKKVVFLNRKTDFSVSPSITVDGEELYCPVFGNCAENMIFEIPYDEGAGKKGSLEYYLEKHCNNGVVFKE